MIALAVGIAVTKLLTCSGAAVVKPAGTYVFACGDANTQIRRTHWQKWSATEAVGTTQFGVNFCNPNCVSSKFQWIPQAQIVLDKPKKTSHGTVFTRGVVSYRLNGKPGRVVVYPRSN